MSVEPELRTLQCMGVVMAAIVLNILEGCVVVWLLDCEAVMVITLPTLLWLECYPKVSVV